MIHKKLLRQVAPHVHGDGRHHRAHALSLPALLAYLQLLFVLVIAFYFVQVAAPAILGKVTFSAEEIVKLTNVRRREFGLGDLTLNPLLQKAAVEKAGDMHNADYWAHNSPGGKTPWSFITAAGYRYLFAGENLARDFNDATSVVNAWMNSPTHRSNLLDRNFNEIGVAVASGKLNGREGVLVVQMFGSRAPQALAGSSALQPGTTQVESSLPAPRSVTVLASQKFSIARMISLVLVGMLFLLFAVEVVVSSRRLDMSVKSNIFAHLAILGFILLVVWWATAGAVL